MNLKVIILGIMLGWSVLLALPWALTGEPNPLDSPAGWIIWLPLLPAIYVIGESSATIPCPSFTHKRLRWISHHVRHSLAKFALVGFAAGLVSSLPSAFLIVLSVAYIGPLPGVCALLFLVLTGITHLVMFAISVISALMWTKSWGRRLHAASRVKSSAGVSTRKDA